MIRHTGWQAVHWAARLGNPEIIGILAGAGADLDAADSCGRSPLSFTQLGDDGGKQVAEKLLELGAKKPPCSLLDDRTAVAAAREERCEHVVYQRLAALPSCPRSLRSLLRRANYRLIMFLLRLRAAQAASAGNTLATKSGKARSSATRTGPFVRALMALTQR